jgi:GntR family transcriptional repressor for pyruvate dehydrogenase complex
MTLRAIESQSLADQVFEQLVEEIMAGRYQPASNLPSERKLVEIFKVNRHVVREALKRLEQIGLVKVSQGGGTRVDDFQRTAGLDLLALMAAHAHVREDATKYWLAVHEMRAAIAADAARLCSLRAGPEIKKDILKIARSMSDLGEGPEVFALELRFWDRVLEGAGNIAYRLALNSLLKAVFAPEIRDLAREWSIHEVKESGYRIPIATAIAAGDAGAAESRTRESLRGVVDVLDRQLRDSKNGRPLPARSIPGNGNKKRGRALKTASPRKSRPRG